MLLIKDIKGKYIRGNYIIARICLTATKSVVIDTNRLLNVKRMRYPPVEFEDASTMTTGLLRESKGVSSTDNLPRMVDSEMLICGKMKINETDSCRGVSKSKMKHMSFLTMMQTRWSIAKKINTPTCLMIID